jgi:hypothetical protein
MRNFKIVLGCIIILGFAAFGISTIVSTSHKLQAKEVQLKTLDSDMVELESKYKKLNSVLDKATKEKNLSQEEMKKLQDEKARLEKEKADLQAELQAKIENRKKLAAAATLSTTAHAASGGCAQWMAQAGITHPIAVELIGRESGCNPCAYNPGQSDCGYTGDMACGIPQALPCSKLRAACQPWNDPACQLKWMQSYIYGRYGSWEAAKAFHDSHGWY